MSKKVLLGVFAVMSLAFVAGCGDKKESKPAGGGAGAAPAKSTAAPADGPEVKLDPATAGAIKGKVTFSGVPDPMPKAIDMGPKAGECNTKDAPKMEEWYVAGENNAAANVIVYVKSGPATRVKTAAPTTEVMLDQVNCMYTPRVIGMRAGQPLKIKSSDPTSHNIHVQSKYNGDWNKTMNANSSFIAGEGESKKIDNAEVPVKVKCDIHAWMGATIGTFNHDAFFVTKKDGMFELKNLPPGDYEVEVYHERYKAKAQKVTVGAKETKDLNFVLKVE